MVLSNVSQYLPFVDEQESRAGGSEHAAAVAGIDQLVWLVRPGGANVELVVVGRSTSRCVFRRWVAEDARQQV